MLSPEISANVTSKCSKENIFGNEVNNKNRYIKFVNNRKSKNHDHATPIPPLDWTKYDTEPPRERCSIATMVLLQFGICLALFLSYLNRLLFPQKVTKEKNREGYAPLYTPFEEFFSHYVYRRGRHCFNWPVCSASGSEITLLERTSDDYNWTLRLTGRKLQCINLGSYNYVGYRGGKDEVEAVVRRYGIALNSSRTELGSCLLHLQLESDLADFLGVEAQARVAALRENSLYFRQRLHAMGVVIYGHPQSPVVPMMVYSMTKMAVCVQRLTAAGVASVGVCFPATPLYLARMRFCLSAAHTREHLDKTLAAIEAVVDELGLRYSRLKPAATVCSNASTKTSFYESLLTVWLQNVRKLLELF